MRERTFTKCIRGASITEEADVPAAPYKVFVDDFPKEIEVMDLNMRAVASSSASGDDLDRYFRVSTYRVSATFVAAVGDTSAFCRSDFFLTCPA